MGAVASCVERVGKRRPDGPLLQQERMRYDESREPGAIDVTAAPPGQQTDRGSRRKPTVSPAVSKESMKRYTQPDEEEAPARDITRLGSRQAVEDAGEVRRQRLDRIRNEIGSFDLKVKSGLFDKSIRLDLDPSGNELVWYPTAGNTTKPLGKLYLADVLKVQPSKKDNLVLEVVTRDEVLSFVFADSDTRTHMQNNVEALKKLLGRHA